MKYSTEGVINRNIDDVIRLFDDPKLMMHWMEGLQSFEHVSGTPGQPGAKSKLIWQMGKRKMEMMEEVLVRNLPYEFTGMYTGMGKTKNIVRNKFESLGPNKTRYITEQEFIFAGPMKFFAPLMKGMFKKQSKKYMDSFVKFAEKHE